LLKLGDPLVKMLNVFRGTDLERTIKINLRSTVADRNEPPFAVDKLNPQCRRNTFWFFPGQILKLEKKEQQNV
jgi:hypothetical protein